MVRRIRADGDSASSLPRPLRGGLGIVVFAPLVLVAARIAGIGLEDPFADAANAGRFLAVELLSFATTVAFLPAALFLAWVLGGRQCLTGSIGAALVVLGVVGSVGIYALDFASVELARAGPSDEMRSIFIAMLANPGVRVLRSFELGLPIGLLVLASGALARARCPLVRIARYCRQCRPVERHPSRRRRCSGVDAAPGGPGSRYHRCVACGCDGRTRGWGRQSLTKWGEGLIRGESPSVAASGHRGFAARPAPACPSQVNVPKGCASSLRVVQLPPPGVNQGAASRRGTERMRLPPP